MPKLDAYKIDNYKIDGGSGNAGKSPYVYNNPDAYGNLSDYDGTYLYYSPFSNDGAGHSVYKKYNKAGTLINTVTLPYTGIGGLYTRYGIVKKTGFKTIEIYNEAGTLTNSITLTGGSTVDTVVGVINNQIHSVYVNASNPTAYNIYAMNGTFISQKTLATMITTTDPRGMLGRNNTLLINYRGGIVYLDDSSVLKSLIFDGLDFGLLLSLLLT